MKLFAKHSDVSQYDHIPVRICLTAHGEGQDILRHINMPSSVRKVVTFHVKVKYPQNRFWEDYAFPPIEQGNAREALRHLEMLSKQNVLSKDRQEEIATIIELAEKATR